MTTIYSERWLLYFMDVAERTAQLSYANRLKVGAVAVRDKRIILVGYNGTPPDQDNVCEQNGKTLPHVLHAEENLILSAMRFGIGLPGCSIFITHSPCINCARLIYGSGISSVYYKTLYHDDTGIRFLSMVNIPTYHICQ